MKTTYKIEEYKNSSAIIINRVTTVDGIKYSESLANILYHKIGITKARQLTVMMVDELMAMDKGEENMATAKGIVNDLINAIKA